MNTFSQLTPKAKEQLRELLEGYYGNMGTLQDWPLRTVYRLVDGIPYDDQVNKAYELLKQLEK